MNQTRKLYLQRMLPRKQSEPEVDKAIADGKAVLAFRETRVAELLENFIEEQRSGQSLYLQTEIGSLTGLGWFKFFNTFLKFVYMLQENRAYRKLEAYLDDIERKGVKYERERQKAAERRAAAESSDRPKQ